MASNPPGQCCAVGVKHEGTAQGEIKKVGDVRTYLSYPKDKSTQNAILILTDIIGMDFINVQLIADQFAQNGYFVAIPDLFNGAPATMNDPSFDVHKWLAESMPKVPTVDPIVEGVIKELRGSYGVKRLGGVGYCFGAKYVCRWLKEGSLDVGFVAHPSFVESDEVKGIRGPLCIAAAETDAIFPAPKRHETEEILKEMGAQYQMTLYSGVEHGFAVRCDLKERRQKWAKEQAFLQAVAWFGEFLKA